MRGVKELQQWRERAIAFLRGSVVYVRPSSHVLPWHLGQRILMGIGGVLLVVLMLLSLVDFIDELRHVRIEGYGFTHALLVVLWGTPQRIYEVLPVCVFVGSLLILGQLVADNEMTALRVSGFGGPRLVPLLLTIGLIMSGLTIFTGEVLTPLGTEAGRQVKHQHQPGASSSSLWLREGQDFMHLRWGSGSNHTRDVLVYQMDEGKLRRGIHAQSARYDGTRWVLRDVRESVLKADGNVEETQHAHYTGVVLPPPFVLELMLMPPDEMSIRLLNRYLGYFDAMQTDVRPYQFARWQRIATPLSCLVVLLLTLPFALTQSRGGGLGQRIFIGVISGIGIYVFNRMFAHLGMMWGFAPWLAAFLPLFLLLLLAGAILTIRQINVTVRISELWRSIRHANIAVGR